MKCLKMVEKTHWRLREPKAVWDEVEISQKTAGHLWNTVREDAVDSCLIFAHTHTLAILTLFLNAGTLVGLWSRPGSPGHFVWPRHKLSISPLLVHGTYTSSCSSCSWWCHFWGLFVHLPPPSLPSVPGVTQRLLVCHPGTWKAYGTLRTGNPGDLSRGGSSVSCLCWVILS